MRRVFIILLVVGASLAAMASPQDRRPPLSKDEVYDLLISATPRKVIIDTIERYGIAFQPTDAVLEDLRQAGADKALLSALRQAWHVEIPKPLTDKEIRMLLAADAPSQNIVRFVLQRGIDFRPTAAYLDEIRTAGAKDDLIHTLRSASPRPFNKEELLQLLGTHADEAWIAKMVQQRGIDFAPDTTALSALRKAGAQPPLLQTIRNARREKPFVAQTPPAPALVEAGGLATLTCEPAEKEVPVFADPHNIGVVAARLPCGAKVTFLEEVNSPPGFDKIQYADEKQGFVASAYLGSRISRQGGNATTAPANVSSPAGSPGAPVVIFKPDAPYTPEARRDRLEGTVVLQIVVDVQGSVSEVRETSPVLGKGLDQSAIDTVRKWRFNPATRDGVPVPVRVQVEMNFRLYRDDR